MPQMMPMNWLLMFLMIFILMIFICIKINFLINENDLKMKSLSKNKMMVFKFKW
uniref:ATP synthase F0 subunit 8 n=1 Tax=Anastatus dexingensis TaxID=2926466 RepID=A0A9E8Y9K9_9HYME|nr:ATP synthase F0 subunit 8 [Anastatus dexingensis]WAJ57477.1 ATP synthase F0 subunit 8 [Anastatus dexingensis]